MRRSVDTVAASWDEVRSPTLEPSRRRALEPWLGPLVVVIIGAWWWTGGHTVRAAIALLGAVVAMVTVMVSDRARRGAIEVGERVAAAAGTALSFLLFGSVFVFVIVPIGLVDRAFARIRRVRPATGWLVFSGAESSLSERPFGDERVWQPASGDGPVRSSALPGHERTIRRRSRGFRPGPIVGVLASIALVGLLTRVVVDRFADEPADRAADQAAAAGVTGFDTLESAALRDLSWSADAMEEAGRVGGGIVYTPYTGVSLRDFSGTYVNVEDRVRRSYEPEIPDGTRPLEIWFFGGSTTFGFDLQRDEHTIPSEVARMAERSEIPVRVTNYGAPGYTNYQETVLLSLLVTGGRRPDVVVFYDGVNDWAAGLLGSLLGVSPAGEPSDLFADRLRSAMAGGGDFPGATDAPPAPLGTGASDRRPPEIEDLVGDVTRVYGQGAELARALGDEYGFEVVHYWQPDIYSKQPLDPGEDELLPKLRLDPFRFDAVAGFGERVRAALPAESSTWARRSTTPRGQYSRTKST